MKNLSQDASLQITTANWQLEGRVPDHLVKTYWQANTMCGARAAVFPQNMAGDEEKYGPIIPVLIQMTKSLFAGKVVALATSRPQWIRTTYLTASNRSHLYRWDSQIDQGERVAPRPSKAAVKPRRQ